ncbi:sugar ABC transporter permease [Paenibacillus filicis]|uniref:Sugar ABC transporter permease n=1 Tax=Paenibacillus gyeongsangnamensis TaxID=3388067 RepID=A0ABT4QF39_9BACL|nr:sugar ABC transporter permease [Paenibacillus filicis]MCZ8515486.1 sugar ABC transporter permease [Paenibacillus filicis]
MENSKTKRKVDLLPIYYLLPSLLLIVLINFYPFLSGLFYSLSDGSLVKQGSFVGLANYVRLFGMPDFGHSLVFSAIFAFFSVIGSYVIGLGLAVLLNKDFPGRGFFRVALLVPWIVPSIVSIISWRWMLGAQEGLVNTFLVWLGLEPVLFLANEKWAIFTVCLIKIWRSFPFMMVSCLAGLQSIDSALYESAAIDGAGRWKSFVYITLPQLKSISIVCWILMTIWSFNDFDTIWLLTQGGPANATENLIILAYKYTFTKNDVGTGSAMAIIALIILMMLATLFLKNQNKEQDV